MDWVPVVFIVFKAIVLVTGMFFAIKWHYDQGKKAKESGQEKRAVLRATGKVAAIFILLLLALGLATFFFSNMLGLELSFS